MKSRLSIGLAALSLLVPLGSASARPAAVEADKSDNVKHLAHFQFDNESDDFFAGGTDIDFQGKYVYAMQQGNQGGVHIIEHGKKPKYVSFIPCPGSQNDVAVVKPGLLALGFHSTMCGTSGGGVRLIDVKNPKQPKFLGAVNDLPGGTHTLTAYPGEDIIYASPGGLPSNGDRQGTQYILDVSNPQKPEIAATFTANPASCHDFAFYISKDVKLGACPGLGSTTIFDVSDPLAPEPIGAIAQPFNQFNHSVAFTHDGKYMVLGDEAIAGNDCVGGPTGALFIYDMSNPTLPVPMSYFAIDRAPEGPAGSPDIDRDTWCSSHLFNFVPGTYTLVSSWYAGGMNVIDFSDPSSPQEVAHFMGTGEDITNYWSAYWFDGRIYANDRVDGVDVFEVKGLKEGKHQH
jgi:hypothetical protein